MCFATMRVKHKQPVLFWIGWCLVLWTSTVLRLASPDWDQGVAAHPDERFLLGVAHDLSLYANPCEVSPDFPYGQLPVTLISFLVRLVPQADPLYSSRLLSGLGGVLLVALTGHCGFRLSRSRTGGLLAAVLAAFCPFLIQQGHFYTVDPWAAIFCTLAMLLAMKQRWYLSGGFVGLAVACKASSVWFGVSLGVVMMIVRPSRAWTRSGLRLVSGFLSGLFIGSPWLVLAPLQCWRGPFVQAQLASGRFTFPYTRQYAQTLPWIYPFVQMLLWGMGPVITLAGCLTLCRSFADAAWKRRPYVFAVVPTVLFFVVTGGLYVKYPRYLLPIYPLWIGFAAKGCLDLFRVFYGARRWWGRVGLLLILTLPTCILGIAQASVYTGLHPWVQASRWIYAHIDEGATLVVESWDHPLPVPLPSGDPSRYEQVTVSVLDHSQTSISRLELLDLSRASQAVVLASRRNYGVVARRPERFEAMYRWYETLFEEREALVFSRCPRIGWVAFSDDPFRGFRKHDVPSMGDYCDAEFVIRLPRLDESFRVYDAPTTVILLSGSE
jgi:hypothetical protein